MLQDDPLAAAAAASGTNDLELPPVSEIAAQLVSLCCLLNCSMAPLAGLHLLPELALHDVHVYIIIT
jgi:hypothetical protein